MTFGVWSKTANHVRAFCLPVWWIQVSLWPKQIFKTLVLHKGHLLYLRLISGSLWITSPGHRGAMHWYHPLDGTQFGSVRNVQMFSIRKLESRFFHIFQKLMMSSYLSTSWPLDLVPIPYHCHFGSRSWLGTLRSHRLCRSFCWSFSVVRGSFIIIGACGELDDWRGDIQHCDANFRISRISNLIVYIYIDINTYTIVYIYTYKYTYIYTHMYEYIHVYMHAYIYIYTYYSYSIANHPRIYPALHYGGAEPCCAFLAHPSETPRVSIPQPQGSRNWCWSYGISVCGMYGR